MSTEEATRLLPLPPTSGMTRGVSTTSQSILRELYAFVCKGKQRKNEDSGANSCSGEALCIGDAIQSLRREGILFWRDQRFFASQTASLRIVGQAYLMTHHRQIIPPEVQKIIESFPMNYDVFCEFASPCGRLFLQVFSEELVIPDWSSFTQDMMYHFKDVESNTSGQTAQYIPILKNANPDFWGLSICSIDGQRLSLGDAAVPHTLQSVSKPVTYALGLQREGADFMEEWIDVEPAGRAFNTQDLDTTNRPFNASINSGAIMAAGIFASGHSNLTWWQIVDKIRQAWSDLCGNDGKIGFSQETFNSEKETAYNNFAIAYNLKGRRGLPRNVDLHTMLDVYLGCCSIEITTEALSVAAATLGNGGICPITGKEVFPADVVRTVLAETSTCGMYNQAGHFAVTVGVPAKSGVSGALLVIVPNLFGLASFSPRLNEKGNSVRGIAFCEQLVRSYRIHTMEPRRSGNARAKIDPSKNGNKEERKKISRLAWAVNVGDVYALRLRDIFLYALCQTAFASPEGLSERTVNMIRSCHHQIFQRPINETLLHSVQENVKKYPGEMRLLEELTREVYVLDGVRSLIIMAMLDIVMADGSAGDAEKAVVTRIAVLLGIDEKVVELELNRYSQHSGHHFQTFEYCNLIGTMDEDVSLSLLTSVEKRSPSPAHSGKSFARIQKELLSIQEADSSELEDDQPSDVKENQEILLLRQENLRLRRKIAALTDLLGSRSSKSIAESESPQ